MILLMIRRKNGHQIFFKLLSDNDLRVVEQITDRLAIYLEGVEFKYVPMEGGDAKLTAN